MEQLDNSNLLSQKDQIAVLLEEYKTLRAELLERHTAVLQLLAITTAGLIATIGFTIANTAWIAGLITGLILFCGICAGALLLDNDSRLLSARLQEIEAAINRLAGKQLLVWESTRGIEKMGYDERLSQTWRRWRP
jgi:hypothetical protein